MNKPVASFLFVLKLLRLISQVSEAVRKSETRSSFCGNKENGWFLALFLSDQAKKVDQNFIGWQKNGIDDLHKTECELLMTLTI